MHTFLFNIFVKFPSFDVEKLWKNTWNDKMITIKGSKKNSPNKKDWEGGPGMLSNADL